MTLLSIVLALMFEQFQPLARQRFVLAPLVQYAHFLEDRLNDGQARHGTIAWFALVLPIVLLVFLLQWLVLHQAFWLLLSCVVLYVSMGFRQFSHYFTDIHLALRMGELDRARALLGEWSGQNTERFSSQEIARRAIEEALVASHRHVFAPIFFFALLGPVGAVLYRLALFVRGHWGHESFGAFGQTARQAFLWIDAIPLRLTAAAFAVVGDFEDAAYCWRTQAQQWPERGLGILLASGAGALGVRLGQPVHEVSGIQDRPELGLGEEADADFMQSTIGLAWRTLVLLLLLLALFWVANWIG